MLDGHTSEAAVLGDAAERPNCFRASSYLAEVYF